MSDDYDVTDIPDAPTRIREPGSRPRRGTNPGRSTLRTAQPAKAADGSFSPDAARTVLNGLGQLVAGALFPINKADAAAVYLGVPPIVDEVVTIAENDAKWADVLNKIVTGGPYAKLTVAVVSLGMQLAANHGKIKPGTFGTVEADELAQRISAQEGDNTE